MVLRNSILSKPLSDGPVLSIMVHKQLVRICLGGGGGGGGLMGLSPRPHVDWQDRDKKITLSKLGYQLPKWEILVIHFCVRSRVCSHKLFLLQICKFIRCYVSRYSILTIKIDCSVCMLLIPRKNAYMGLLIGSQTYAMHCMYIVTYSRMLASNCMSCHKIV